MSRSVSVRSFVAATLVQSLMQGAAAAPPVLPTPCLGGPCGRNSANTPFVTAGVASAIAQGNNLTVNQQSNSAILNWQNFNIGSGNSVTFNQPSATAAALNRIWSADPSVIAGALKANGQIYLLNQNGIVFANGAQVNVGSLTASTLEISDQLFLKGLLSGNSGELASGGLLPPVFQLKADADPSKSTVSVAPGATIQTADGGRVMLIGTTVNNAGTIATPDGQTILAAGTTVYLASTSDPSLRGLLIAVDSGENAANSTAANSGTITAERGNVTVAGMLVNQQGRITATTSVNANGSIYLVAGDADPNAPIANFYTPSEQGLNAGQLLPNTGGTVNLQPGSVTEVVPDTTSTTTITSAQTFYPSQVSAVGKNVNLLGNAQITAPGAQVNLEAFDNPFQGVTGKQTHAATGGRVYLDSQSNIDVSGLQNVSAPASQNLIQIELGANELQDDPLLRTGVLHGSTVTVDLAKGTPLLNQATLDSYASTVGHSLQEVLSTAGTINLTSGGDVITRSGSVQNVSGGSIAFQNSSGATTKLLGADGKVYDIGSAPNNIQYLGFADSYSYTDPRWGTQTNYKTTGTIAGYLQGSSAGAINILAPNVYLAGTMLAHTTPGPYQRGVATLPGGGAFNIGDAASAPLVTGDHNFDAPALNLVASVTDSLGSFDPLSAALPASGPADLGIGDLAANGFNRFSIASNGSVVLPSTTHLDMQGNGSLAMAGAAVTVAGTIHSSGSAVTLTTYKQIAGEDPTAPTDITLGQNAVIDVSGNWVNDSPLVTTAVGTGPTLFGGGSVSMQAAADSNVVLGAGSLVDVSGGGWVNSANKLTAGAGGSITLKSGGPLQASNPAIGGVSLQGTLRGAALNSGGKLTITSASVTVASDHNGQAGELDLSPDFFQQGGFGSYSITGINNLVLGSSKDGASESIQPVQWNLQFNGSMLQQKSAANLQGFTSLQKLPSQYRAPTSVSFAATHDTQGELGFGDLTVNAGATIATDPGATVSLSARGDLTVAGTISAPAGTINLAVAPSLAVGTNNDDGYIATQQLLLKSTAQLLAPGFAAIYSDNRLGLRQGQVLSAGTVNIVANKGSVVAQTGSLIDVSGSSGTVDIAQQGRGIVPTTVAGSAGRINIEALGDIVLNSTLRGNAADVPGAAGGTLSIGLDRFNLATLLGYNAPNPAHPYPTNDRNLIITSDDTRSSNELPLDSMGNIADGIAKISADTINAGGFDNVRLNSVDVVTFDGSAAITTRSTLTINALEIASTPGARATLNSAYVALGNNGYYQANTGESGRVYSPLPGDGTLTVNAGTIDLVGNSALSGFQSAALNATHDIRLTYGTGDSAITDFTGSLKSSADLVFKAAQIYPTTNATFTINPADAGSDPTLLSSYSYAPGKVTLLPVVGASPQTPLSALGKVAINSPSLNQYGVLIAPFGQITLDGIGDNSVVALHAGSVTSVSAGTALIPYGSTQNGRQWTYQVDDNGNSPAQSVLSQIPSKQVTLNGSDVLLDANSKVDVSGGGDLYAYEFIAGTGGSKDVLFPGVGYQYAILPSLGSAYAPIDQQYSIGSSIGVGRQVYLGGAPGLAAGYYTLLPARYALLPGAYAVSLVQQNSDILQNSAVAQPGGSYQVAGQFAQAGTSILDSRTSTFLVASSAVVRTQSEYTDSYANAFFYNAAAANNTKAVNLPADAGQLALSATQQLHPDGTIGFSAAQFVAGKDSKGNNITVTGVGGTASIVASAIEVVEPGAAQDGSLQLTAQSLNNLGAADLILGATRTAGSQADTLNVGATTVTLANGSADPLTAPQVILAATQTVSLGTGSSINATGTTNDKTTQFNVVGDGALLRATSGSQATVVRTIPDGTAPAANLQVASGASITAQSLILDAGLNTQIDSGSNITAQNVGASSGRISLGDVPADTPGLNVTTALLGNFKGLTNLSLRSASTIDFYGSVALGTTGSDGSPTLQTVTLDAAGLAGYGTGNKAVTAGNIALLNSGSTPGSPPFLQTPDGTGTLTMTSVGTAAIPAQVTLGAGGKTLSGFGGVTLSAASGDIRASKSGSLTLTGAGDLTLSSARLSTDSAAQQSIQNTTGGVTIANAGSASALPAAGLGGQLTVSGTAAAGSSAIVVSSLVSLPSGSVNLQAQGGGDLTVTGTGQIYAAGVVKSFYDTYAASDAGSVTLASSGGNVALQSGAVIDVSGATSADGKVSGNAGSVSILAPQGTLTLAGSLRGAAAPGQNGGNFSLDSLGNADHSGTFSLSTLGLSSNGFTGDISIRDRSDSSVLVDGTNRLRSLSLTADAGNITVTGNVDASGATNNPGGDISLWAMHDLTLASGSSLSSAAGKAANGVTQRGGDITLGSAAGVITLASGSAVDLSGSAGQDNPGTSPDGKLRLLAAYNTAANTLGIAPIAASVASTTPASITVDAGLPAYGDFASFTSQAATDIQTFSTQESALAAGLTPTGASFSVQVRPWVTVSNPGDVAVSSLVDLHALAANANNGAPIDLTVRAGGNLLVNNSISDGFVAAAGKAASKWNLVAGDSANLELTAGADLSSANPLATQAGTGKFILNPTSLVRTGNGNIDIAAGQEVCIGCTPDGIPGSTASAQQAVIYTAGQPSTNGPATFTAPVATSANVTPEFGTGGGNITLTSGGDIVSAPTTNLVTNWLWRQGAINNATGAVIRDTAWWVESNAFQQGVGALGGGNINVQAAGNITDLSVVIPTNGRVGVVTNPNNITNLSANTLVVDGGGDLNVRAGGNVQGGLFEADLGHGSIFAGASIGASSQTTFAPVLVLANSDFQLNAGGSATIDGVLNSTFIPEAAANTNGIAKTGGLPAATRSYFYTYSPDSALSVTSAGGDANLNNNIAGVLNAASNAAPLDNSSAGTIEGVIPYPASLNVAAMSGDVTVGHDLVLFPSSTGNLTVLANNGINLNGSLNMSELDSSQLASLVAPISTVSTNLLSGELPSTPLHAGDPNPIRIVAATGDIVQQTQAGPNVLPKQSDIIAGGNIVNLDLISKNLNPSDVTVIQAGGNIQFDTTRDPTTNQLTGNSVGIQVGGPGYVEAVAGGGIDLGDSQGIVTTGRSTDPRLPAVGASLVVAAGLGNNADGSLRAPSYDAFINKYLASTSVVSYAAALLSYDQSLFPARTDITASNALSVFESLARPQQLPFISQVLTDELSATGLAHTIRGTTYQRGFDAINTLFPTKDAQGNALTYKGDINMFFSQLKTTLGGDIDLLAPGGSVVVGVPNPPQALNAVKGQPLANPPISAESQLGLLVLAQGAVQGFANGDFDVNQSRILTLQGGNIILWASTGSIDAGKGAKTAQGAPPPVIQTDTNGNIFVNPIGAVAGSGIGQLLTVQGVKPGLVNLIAPAGVVNAGEAGIRVAGDINIAATAVLNVGNIKVGGTATGLPVSDAGALSGALSGANSLGDAGKTVADQLTSSLTAGNNLQQLTESLTPTFISVRMFCLGVQCDAQ